MSSTSLIEVPVEEWKRISTDYKGWCKGKRCVFAGCIKKDGGTTLLLEGEHFIVVMEKSNEGKGKAES
jgi:hypothetical protein